MPFKSSGKARPFLLNAGLSQVPIKPAESGIDPAGSASTVVLRDVHCALMRLIQNQGLEKEKKDSSKGQPSTAKLFSPDSGGPVPWTALLAQISLAAPDAKAGATAKVCNDCMTVMHKVLLDVIITPFGSRCLPVQTKAQLHLLLTGGCFYGSVTLLWHACFGKLGAEHVV